MKKDFHIPKRAAVEIQAAPNSDSSVAEREADILGKPARIAPLPFEAVAQQALESTAGLRNAASRSSEPVTAADVPEILMTLLRHPELYRRLSDLSIQLLRQGALTPRDRELAVLRVAWLCQAPYEWGEHVRMAKREGLTPDEIERVTEGSAAIGWDEHQCAILRAAEELHQNAMISDATWDILSKRLDEKQLYELPILVGQFTNVAYLQNSLRLRLSPDNIGLRAR